MGIFGNMNGKNQQSGTANTGEHMIDGNQAMRPTDASAITPTNPGTFSSIRSIPVCGDPRYFTDAEANALEGLAVEKAAGAHNARKAFKNMSRIETTDAMVHGAHKEYLYNVAVVEGSKVAANGKLAAKLHSIRPAYAQTAQNILNAEQQANLSIASRTGRILNAKKQ